MDQMGFLTEEELKKLTRQIQERKARARFNLNLKLQLDRRCQAHCRMHGHVPVVSLTREEAKLLFSKENAT